jgi:hypothetical protein
MKRSMRSGGARRRGSARSEAAEHAPAYTLTFHYEPVFLHAIVTGINSKQNVVRYLEEVQRECMTRGYTRVLIEEHLEGPRLDTLSVFQVAARGSSKIEHPFEAIAYVDANVEGDLMEFAETVAVNRDLPVAVFASVMDAKNWLLSQESAGAHPVQEFDPTPGRPRPS